MKTEAENFANAATTTFFRFLSIQFACGRHYGFGKNFPYMEDYTKPWDNKRFCKYFGITGYISDTQAAPNSDWEEILRLVHEYNR